jgi:phage baseplate assembly protein W
MRRIFVHAQKQRVARSRNAAKEYLLLWEMRVRKRKVSVQHRVVGTIILIVHVTNTGPRFWLAL